MCGEKLETQPIEKIYNSATTDSKGEAVVGGYLVTVTDTDTKDVYKRQDHTLVCAIISMMMTQTMTKAKEERYFAVNCEVWVCLLYTSGHNALRGP